MFKEGKYFSLVLFLVCTQALLVSTYSFADDDDDDDDDDEFFYTKELLNSSAYGFGESISLGFVIPDGVYPFSVVVNGKTVEENFPIEIVNAKGKSKVKISSELVTLFDLDVDINKKFISDVASETVLDIQSYIADSDIGINVNNMIVNVSIPNINQVYRPRGYYDKNSLDYGENLAYLTYFANGSFDDNSSDFLGVSLTGGVNINKWQIRSVGVATKSEGEDLTYINNLLYANRPIPAIQSNFRVGRMSTSYATSSFLYNGVTLFSDAEFRPQSLRGYAPNLTGVADTNATVEVYQNDMLIYKTTVAPGAFEITDIYPTGSSSDLVMIITEEDGQVKTASSNFSSSFAMLRKGQSDYQMTFGQAKGVNHQEGGFFSGSFKYGLNNALTIDIGSLAAKGYWVADVGAGLNLGAFGSTYIEYYKELGSYGGYSTQFSYTKQFSSIGTRINVRSLLHESNDFLTFNEHIDNSVNADNLNRTTVEAKRLNIKNRGNIDIYQPLFDRSSLTLSASETSYWSGEKQNTYQAMLSSTIWDNVNLYLTGGKRTYLNNEKDDFITLSVNVPFSSSDDYKNRSYHNVRAEAGVRNSDFDTASAGVSGTFKDASLNYNASVSRNAAKENRYRASLGYNTDYGLLTAGYSKSPTNETLSYGAQGSIVGFSEGLILSKPITDTFAIIQVPDVEGVAVNSQSSTNGSGLAIAHFVQPYKKNNISIDVSESQGVQADSTSQNVVPVKGAGVFVSFDVSKGYEAIFHITKNGQPIPLGSSVRVNGKLLSSQFGTGGNIYLLGVKPQGTLEVFNGNELVCQLDYVIDDVTKLNRKDYQCE
ncbi:fimbria/pilus outer membrane usher protein [Shewanella gaetbuli]